MFFKNPIPDQRVISRVMSELYRARKQDSYIVLYKMSYCLGTPLPLTYFWNPLTAYLLLEPTYRLLTSGTIYCSNPYLFYLGTLSEAVNRL